MYRPRLPGVDVTAGGRLDYLGTMFSSRVPPDLTPNRLARALARLGAGGVMVADLTGTNPTQVGLPYPAGLLAPLSAPDALEYDPHPFGLRAARQAVSGEFQRQGVGVGPDRVVLTASTSEAYSLLFKLLCDPGDEVLVPQPSYPLFDHLTRLDAVTARPYRLEFHGAWAIDAASVRRALTPRTRAILVVSPNNPTGSFATAGELVECSAICAEHALALVGDEVFADYVMQGDHAHPASVLGRPEALTFGLGGLSKSAGLPQLKLGWIGVGGPDRLVADALARLEVIADAYLSVSTPVQIAAGALIRAGGGIRAGILERVRLNHRQLEVLVAAYPSCTLLPVEGGWSAVIQVPATRTEEALVLDMLEQDHVLVHPGYFFDFPREAFIVVSLLPPPGMFRDAVTRVLDRAATD